MIANTDRAWFRKNPQANVRVRRPVEGEVEELARRMAPGCDGAIAAMGGKWHAPESLEWRIAVINAGPDLIVRMLTIGDETSPQDKSVFELFAIVFADRLAIDHRRI